MTKVEHASDGLGASGSATATTGHLWSSILETVQSTSTRSASTKSILVLGAKGCGKSFLMNKLKFNASINEAGGGSGGASALLSDALGLEYTYADVKDDENDDLLSALGVWLLDEDLLQQSVLSFALNEASFSNTLVCLLVDLSRPWTIMDTLKHQVRFLEEYIDTLVDVEDDLPKYKEQLKTLFQKYSAALASGAAASTVKQSDGEGAGEQQVLPPLEPEVLSRNIGLPIVIVGCKSDLLPALERELNYKDEHFDFVQQNIRKFALRHGAAVVYTSARDSKNIDLLRKYILHRLYGTSFKESGNIAERDAVFVPMGWDSETKINILLEGVASFRPTDIYETVIKKPHSRKTQNAADEAAAKDDQAFLQEHAPKLLKLREKLTGSTGSASSAIQQDAKQLGAPASDSAAAPGASPSASPAKTVQKKEAIQSFFNSLLSQPKKGGAASGGPAAGKPGDGAAGQAAAGAGTGVAPADGAARKDVHAALDQIRNKSG